MKVSFLLLVSLSAVAQSLHVVHERRSAVPQTWSLTRRAPSSRVIPLRIGLKQANIDKLYGKLMEVSHPDSPQFGQHWSPQQVADFFRPSKEATDSVRTWLAGAGFDPANMRMANGGHWIEVDSTIGQAEELLQTEYHVYEHGSGKEHLACESYSLPEEVQPQVELVTPTVHFDAPIPRPRQESPQLRRRASNVKPVSGAAKSIGKPSSLNGPKLSPDHSSGRVQGLGELDTCDQAITPACLRALYNIAYTPKAAAKNTFGIVEYTPQAFLASDLDLFFVRVVSVRYK